MRQFDGIGLAKAILWEEAKGKLRAIVMADGSVYNSSVVNEKYHYEYIEEMVEEFIKEFESKGYQE